MPSFASKETDLFFLLGDMRPAYRWIIIGPRRSGSNWHIDPNATSAWNGLIAGEKRWIMCPPNSPPPGVFPRYTLILAGVSALLSSANTLSMCIDLTYLSPDGAAVATPLSIMEWMNDYYEVKLALNALLSSQHW